MQNHEILINNHALNKSVFAKLNNLLKSNDLVEVNFLVAFISSDGIYLLINELQELISKQVKVVIITGFMNNFNSPKALELLLRIPGLEVRVANIANFHSKLYIFKHSDHYSYIVGSSNLTNNALRRNEEMNICIENKHALELNQEFAKYSHDLYHASSLLTDELLADYSQRYYQSNAKPKSIDYSHHNITPNKMQKKALANLTALRDNQQQRALLISATGSGKTFLSAFDAKKFKPQKLLFIAHRENLLNNAIASFQQVFSDLNFGKLTGKYKETQAKYLFASILTLHKDETLLLFKPNEFDYIIIDEVHRSGAASYQKVLNYFKPEFMLGMSATPNRNDDFDVYRLFDHNIAYQIRLNEALEEELICPFHYFGIAELQVNGKYLNDYSDFNSIDYHARVKHIISNLKLYGHAGNKVKGLVFTSRIEEAHKLSELFNQAGYRTCCLTGTDNEAKREAAIALLENDYTDNKGNPQAYLDYIFTVDIFNEGIDIPAVNQIVLLRPTQSAIIFVQQIGRGLRKTANKEYCVIIDFIGNYMSNFLIATALSGDNSYDKENLRHFVHEANSIIPANATVYNVP